MSETAPITQHLPGALLVVPGLEDADFDRAREEYLRGMFEKNNHNRDWSAQELMQYLPLFMLRTDLCHVQPAGFRHVQGYKLLLTVPGFTVFPGQNPKLFSRSVECLQLLDSSGSTCVFALMGFSRDTARSSETLDFAYSYIPNQLEEGSVPNQLISALRELFPDVHQGHSA